MRGGRVWLSAVTLMGIDQSDTTRLMLQLIGLDMLSPKEVLAWFWWIKIRHAVEAITVIVFIHAGASSVLIFHNVLMFLTINFEFVLREASRRRHFQRQWFLVACSEAFHYMGGILFTLPLRRRNVHLYFVRIARFHHLRPR